MTPEFGSQFVSVFVARDAKLASRVYERHHASEAEFAVHNLFWGAMRFRTFSSGPEARQLELEERRPLLAVVLVVAVVRLWRAVARFGLGLVLGPLGEGDADGRVRSCVREWRENGDGDSAWKCEFAQNYLFVSGRELHTSKSSLF